MIKKRLKILLTVFFITLIFAMGCQQKGQSFGSLRNIVVLADSLLWEQVGPEVTNVLSVDKYTPQPEMIFVLNRVNPGNIGKLKQYPQILLVGTLDQQGVTKNLFDQLLPEGSKGRQLVENNERSFFPVQNPWAREQLLGVAVSKDLASLRENLQANKEIIFQTFDDHVNDRVFKQVYFSSEQKEIEKELMNKHGWSIRVPHDFMVVVDSTESGFTWMSRRGPKRLLRDVSVYWEKVDDPSILSKEWMLEAKGKIFKDYNEGFYIHADDNIQVAEELVNFQDRYAIKLEGIWQDADGGGPFVSYAFYNESDGRLYLLDGYVWAPEQRKWPYIRQLDIILHTFKTKTDLIAQE